MNPVTGQRFALSWRAEELLPAAATFYRKLEARLWRAVLLRNAHSQAVLLRERAERHLARSADKPWGAFVDDVTADCPPAAGVRTGLGGVVVRHCGYVAVREMLAALAADGLQNGWLRHETFDWNELVTGPAGVTYAGQVQARQLICCEGAAVMRNPYFNWLPITANQGEVLDCAMPRFVGGAGAE